RRDRASSARIVPWRFRQRRICDPVSRGRSAPQESPHFENGLISALFGPHVERMGSPKAPHLSWRDLSLDDCETRTRTSGLVIRESPHQNANLQLHFGPRKNEGMAGERAGFVLMKRHNTPQGLQFYEVRRLPNTSISGRQMRVLGEERDFFLVG